MINMFQDLTNALFPINIGTLDLYINIL